MRGLGALLPLGLLLALFVLGPGCAASGACTVDDECGTLRYCSAGACRQDCTMDSECGAGRICTSMGRCVLGVSDAGASDGGRDAGSDARMDVLVVADVPMVDVAGFDAPFGAGFDGGSDAPVPDVPGLDAPSDTGVDAPAPDTGFDAGRDAGRDAGSGTPAPSTYTYTRAAVGGLNEAVGVAFHPDGTYALVLERTDEVHVYDWASGTAMRFDVRVAGRAVTLDDLAFSSDGARAWIVGQERVGTTDVGVVIVFDDARFRAGDGLLSFSRATATASGERFSGIAVPRAPSGGPGGGRPIVLSQSGSSPYIARLRELDPATGAFSGLFVARATGAGCDDLAFANNEFGAWGIVLACGTNGAEVLYYTDVGGTAEWRPAPGSIGNVSRTDAHPSGAYALIVNWSSRFLHRHEGGALRSTGASPGLVDGIFDVSFSPDGRLALITGRARGASLRGTIYEYRHDLYSMAEITDVSIEGFGIPPYSATSSTYLNDSAFRPGCDGGLVVGGQVSPSSGMVIEFQRTDGVSCP